MTLPTTQVTWKQGTSQVGLTEIKHGNGSNDTLMDVGIEGKFPMRLQRTLNSIQIKLNMSKPIKYIHLNRTYKRYKCKLKHYR